MEIKNIIREKRLELGLTYEELGKMVGVGKSTVRKWETGMIENIKRDNIVALAKALNVSPALIMGWDIDNTINKKTEVNNKINKEPFYNTSSNLSKEETVLLENYNKLNDLGKEKLIEYSNDLIEMTKYIEIKNTVTKEDYAFAAHDDGLDEKTKKKNLKKAKAIFEEMDKEK
ncbi:helix-turn-helix domain-containing protein [Clostridium botulinum]|uniref:helix-turn-helix domain-containing protein n=1 Tax=Clostridium botulinum TaxID=1491 RepID=UPI001C9B15BA|nr:helix-turn-helix domain-containing protein [Clostridium botulinum]